MVGQHVLAPIVIDRHVGAVPDHLRQLVQRKRMGDRQPDDLLLDVVRQQLFARRLTLRMQQGALVQQAQEAFALKAPQITPETLSRYACVLALLTQGTCSFQDRT